MKINKLREYDIEETLVASGYPKSTEIKNIVETKDYKRLEKLAKAPIGSGHDCALKGIVVHADITAPQYWWLQFGRYHFADIISSQSKMHKILDMDIKKQCSDFVDERVIDILEEKIEDYNDIESKEVKRTIFQEIMATSPMGLELTARITTNYLQLKTIYSQRKHSSLVEWEYFRNYLDKNLTFPEMINGGDSD
ncbi:MAG: hypothetical protein ACQEQF_00085 [Bacillota bacterium]